MTSPYATTLAPNTGFTQHYRAQHALDQCRFWIRISEQNLATFTRNGAPTSSILIQAVDEETRKLRARLKAQKKITALVESWY